MSDNEAFQSVLKIFWKTRDASRWSIVTDLVADDIIKATISNLDRIVVTAHMQTDSADLEWAEQQAIIAAITRLPNFSPLTDPSDS